MAKRIKASDLGKETDEKKIIEENETAEQEESAAEETTLDEEEKTTDEDDTEAEEEHDEEDTSLCEKNLHYYVAGFNDRLIATTIDVICLLPIMLLSNTLKPDAIKPTKLDMLSQQFFNNMISFAEYSARRDHYLFNEGGSVIAFWSGMIDATIMILILIPFWKKYQATPGKLLFGMRVVDATTFEPLSTKQSILRGIGYIASMLPVGAGFIAVAFSKKKQGWHDKMAKSIVIFKKPHDNDWKEQSFKRQTKFALIIIILFGLYMLYVKQTGGTSLW